MSGGVHKAGLFGLLPAPWSEDLLPRIRENVTKSRRKVVVLDDDPTGTQTVYGVPVLTTWQAEELAREFANDLPCFYLLTNTRAFPAAEAVRINQEIARNLTVAAMRAPERNDFVVVSRSDSTLRGHFPVETDALGRTLVGGGTQTPPVLLVPYFEAGGRYTVNDVHYVAENYALIPAGETPFAKDAAFGYRSSNLREWVEEKTGGAVRSAEVRSISLDDLRVAGPDAVKAKLLSLRDGEVCIANAAAPRDLEVLAWAALQAENTGSRLIYRTAASFVAALLGLAPRELWRPVLQNPVAADVSSLDSESGKVRTDSRWRPQHEKGGLTIVGSYVPKTTQQLESLLAKSDVERVEISVENILDAAQRGMVLRRAVGQANAGILAGRDVVVFTSRTLVTGNGAEASLAIGNQVSEALVELLRGIQAKPRYLIAKGGITSSDLATRGLGVKRAMVLGQI
ncbi:MAG: hypothetical protein NT154_08585, partial [Verrucomicrobia bacterium]|nr:hypothetical protein [Verrucomicrobiota bacterium]